MAEPIFLFICFFNFFLLFYSPIINTSISSLSFHTPTSFSISHFFASESHRQGLPYNDNERFQAFVDMRQAEAHRVLQHDMIEELWSRRS